MKRTIVFKTNSFPNISETFIVSNIVEAIKYGYEVKIIVDAINAKTNTSQPDLLAKYDLLDKVSKFENRITIRNSIKSEDKETKIDENFEPETYISKLK